MGFFRSFLRSSGLAYTFVNVHGMKVCGLHGFDLSPSEARRLQEELASRVVVGPALGLADVHLTYVNKYVLTNVYGWAKAAVHYPVTTLGKRPSRPMESGGGNGSIGRGSV